MHRPKVRNAGLPKRGDALAASVRKDTRFTSGLRPPVGGLPNTTAPSLHRGAYQVTAGTSRNALGDFPGGVGGEDDRSRPDDDRSQGENSMRTIEEAIKAMEAAQRDVIGDFGEEALEAGWWDIIDNLLIDAETDEVRDFLRRQR